MKNRPCPHCKATTGCEGHTYADEGRCLACGRWATNTEWSRGVCWTPEEIEAMLKVLTVQP